MACSRDVKAKRIRVKVQIAWWFWYYFYTLVFLCNLFGLEPDYDKLGRVIERAVRFRVTK